MFSAVLGLLGTGISAGLGFMQAEQQQQLAWEQLSLQRRAQNFQQDMAMRQWRMAEENHEREKELEKYLKEQNEYNRKVLREEFDLRLGSQRERQAQAKREREYVLERQLKVDKDAAERQAFQIEQYMRNRDLSEDERAYAMRLLEEQRAIAKGEKDEDLRRYYEERGQAADERNFSISQLYRAQQIAAAERADDAAIRDTVINRANGLQGSLDAALRSLGPAPEVPRVTRSDIDNEVALRTATAISDVDRAITKVAGANEANLMRLGMDNSTRAEERRRDLASNAAIDYAKARDMARDSAMRYISGVQDELLQGYSADMARRGTVLGETANVAGAGLNVLTNLRPLRSENDYRINTPIASAIYARNTRSANQYQAPVGLGSAVYDRFNGGTSLGDFLGTASIASMMELNPGSRLQSAQTWGVTSPGTYFSGANAGFGAVANSAGQLARGAFQAAASERGGAMMGLSQALRSLGGLGDQMWQQRGTAAAANGNIYGSPIGPQMPADAGGGFMGPMPQWGSNFWETPGLDPSSQFGIMSGLGFGGDMPASGFGW